MRRAAEDDPIHDDELDAIFRPFQGRRLALAVSGGVDSMVLMHLVARWLDTPSGEDWARAVAEGARPGAAGSPASERPVGLPRASPAGLGAARWLGAAGEAVPPVVVLTVDHGLRPQSAAEAGLVEAAAAALGFPHQTLVWRHPPDTSAPSEAGRPRLPETGIQEKAREARYDLLADCIEAETWALYEAGDTSTSPLSAGAAKRAIVTAHHRDDLVETFLMRLKRGSGLDGLASIRTVETLARRPTRARPYPAEVDLVRPFLDVPKRRLAATATRLGIVWAEDPSNVSQRFERVRLRGDMGELARLGFTASALHATVRRLQRSRDHIEARVSEGHSAGPGEMRHLDPHGGLFASLRITSPESRLADGLDEAGGDRVERALRLAIAFFGGGEEAPSLAQVEALRRHFVGIARAVAAGGGAPTPRSTARTLAGCRLDYWHGKGPREACIRVWREAGRKPLPEMQLEPGDGAWWDDRFALSIAPGAPEAVTVRPLGAAGWSALRRRVPALDGSRGMPPGAAATLPAIWQRDRLVAVPYFDSLPDRMPAGLAHDLGREWERSGLSGEGLYQARFAPVGSRGARKL